MEDFTKKSSSDKRDKVNRAPSRRNRMRKLPDENVRRFLCELCSKPKPMTLKELNQHYHTHGQTGLRKCRYRQPKADQLFTCEICSENLNSLTDLQRHIGTHEDQYSCDICKRGFKQIVDYIIHMKIHSEDNVFRCALCDHRNVSAPRMRRHVLSHDKFKCYRCEVPGCNKTFTISTHFEEHKKYFHTGEKSYVCDVCGQRFMYERVLNRHKVVTHDIGPKQFKCKTCDEVFASYNMRRNHMKIHKEGVVCGICGKTISTSYFKIHERMHTGERPYKCVHCGKAFPCRMVLSQHVQTHTGYRPHKCNICEKCFTQRSSLVIHMRLHTGEKPYTCHFCNKGFVCKSAVNSHIKNCKC